MASDLQNLQKIKHVVVIMLENRSFDHMLGYLYYDQNNVSPLGHPFEGLTGNETNPSSQGQPVKVFPIPNDDHPYFWPGSDPGEGYFNTNSQLFGNYKTPPPGTEATNQGFVKNFGYTLGWQRKANEQKPGSWHIVEGTTEEHIMGMYTPQQLPVLSGLAKGYAVCDHWYCSVPTETLPNRAFVHMATSQGRLNDDDKVYTATTIFNRLSDKGLDWGIYGYNSAALTRQSLAAIPPNPIHGKFGNYQEFWKVLEEGALPAYTFLAPHWGPTGNSQHPNYDVAKGEQLLYQIYQHVKTSPNWNETLLIITYDEHGGCYDHVPPPENAAEPAGSANHDGFNFHRFGVRVPTVLVSPLIEAGTVFRIPQPDTDLNGATPAPTALDHTSILSTLEKRFDLESLTDRDAAAPDIGGVLTLDTPRTDDPLAGVTPPVSEGTPPGETNGEFQNNPSKLQQVSADMASRLPVKDDDRDEGFHHERPSFRTSDEADRYTHWRYHHYYHHDDWEDRED